VRPLHTLQPSRAAVVSVCGHGALLAALVLIPPAERPAPTPTPIITAEIVPLEPAAREASPPQAEQALEPAAERVAHAPTPAPVAPEPAPEPQPEPQPPAPPVVPPPTSEPPQQSAEAVAPPPAAPPAESEPAVAPPSPEAAPETPVAVAAAEEPTLNRPLETHEDDALRRRLSSWTGRLAENAETMSWRDDGQQYRAVLRRLPASDVMGMDQLAVEVMTDRDGERLVTELKMTRLAFSNFGQFINRWDPDVGLHEDVIEGRFHSNTAFTVHRQGRATPVFAGKVTVADGDINTEGPGYLNRRKLFPAGIEMRVRRIALPEKAGETAVAASADRSQTLEHDASLTFHADGTASWRTDGADAIVERRALGEEPFYFVAADGVTVTVQGTVNGKVLVYSPRSIVINDDLRYAADPRTPQADDFLGLVAEGTVEIADPEVTGTGDLEIYASIYARQRFVVRRFSSRSSGRLLIHGSLTAGTISATEPRYSTKIEFDNRLTKMRAPGFPLSDRYELDSSSGEWRVAPATAAR
jgi:outer membrane biosynthesis protein TonB